MGVLTARYRISGGDPAALARGLHPAATVLDVHPEGDDARELVVALEQEHVGDNVVALVAVLLGGLFDVRVAGGVRLVDFEVPAELAAACPGPAFSIEGTRRLAEVPGSAPIIGTIIKPSVGFTPAQTASRVRELGLAGLHFIKDDELMTSPANCPLPERIAAVSAALDEVAERTGRRPMYAFNISAGDADAMLRGHDLVAAAGGTCVMISINHVGPAAFLALRRHASLPLHAHRNGWGFLTRAPEWGLEFPPYARLWRLLGADHLHVNGFANKFWESDESVAAAIQACRAPFAGLTPLMPVVSSGQWGGQAPDQLAVTSTSDVMYLAGGGIQGHPGGIAAGVRAVQAAWDAALAGEGLTQRAARVPELAASLRQFGGLA